MASGGVSRRQLLVGAGLVGAAAVTGVVVVPALRDDPVAGPDDEPSGGAPAAIARVGAAYLEDAPADEQREEDLRSLLPSLTAATASGLVAQFDSLRDGVRGDFEEDRIADVDGWLLSVTEARAAALVHLVG
jgi:hypothetical protein